MRAILHVEMHGSPETLEKVRGELIASGQICDGEMEVCDGCLCIDTETKGYVPYAIRDVTEKYGCRYGFTHEWISCEMCESYDPYNVLPSYWSDDCLMDQYDWCGEETGRSMSWSEALDAVNSRGGNYTIEELRDGQPFHAEDDGGRYITIIPTYWLGKDSIQWDDN